MSTQSAVTIRDAGVGDGAIIFNFIHALADYEKLAHEVVATPERIEEILTRPEARAHAVIAQLNGVPVGMALYFYNFSTFLGRHGIYIEDLYVDPSHRSGGIGKELLQHLAAKAVAEGCGRMEWWVLDWNEPAINFYERIGAKKMDEWTVYRLEGAALQKLARESAHENRHA
jgi:GNAT superfamily N-acetyltransferase